MLVKTNPASRDPPPLPRFPEIRAQTFGRRFAALLLDARQNLSDSSAIAAGLVKYRLDLAGVAVRFVAGVQRGYLLVEGGEVAHP